MRGPLLLLLSVLTGGLDAQPRRVDLIVASTTDVHGRLRGWDYYGNSVDTVRGLSRAATVVDSLRAAHRGRVVLVDAGDLLQGNPLTYVAARVDTARPSPVIAAMNAMRYDAAALGNHEFNYGIPVLRRALRGARFPFLAANLELLGAERSRPLASPFRIINRSGVSIGIVGATNPGVIVWDRENVAGRARVTDIVAAVARSVAEVRRRGANVVVAVLHSGLEGVSSYDERATGAAPEDVSARVAREVPGIDLIVYGHSHREVADTTINGVMLQQPRNWATSVGMATLTVERTGTRWRVVGKRGRTIPVAGRKEHPAVLAAVGKSHETTVAWVNQTLGSTPVAWSADSSRVMDTPIIDFLLEVTRRHTGADLAVSSAFDLNASLDAGPITVAEVARLYPYDNTLRVVRMSGQQVRAFLEYSSRYYRTLGTPEAAQSLVDASVPGYNFDMLAGAEYELDLSQPVGSRVRKLERNGRPIVDTDTFTVAINNYRQGGGGGFTMLHGAPVVYDKQEEIRDLLIAEVRRRGTLRPEDYHVNNWRLLPADVVGPAHRAMRSLPFDRNTAPRRPSTSAAHLGEGRWLRVIGTNDFHGGLVARDYNAEGVVRGGAASLATALRAARAECQPPSCTSIWVDGGDHWQGTSASALTVGRPVTEFLNRQGLAAAALGNHEFDWGIDTMRVRLRENRFPVLAANLKYRDGRDVEWMPDDTLLTVGAFKVGVIGIISPETQRSVRASIVAPFRFADPLPIVEERARALRRRGADAVIVTGHVGATCDRDLWTCTGEAIDIARNSRERLDAIVAGHFHRGTATIVNGTGITQAYQKGSGLGIIDVPLGAPGQQPRVSVRNVRPDSVPPDPAVAAWVDSVSRAVNTRLSATVATMAEASRRATGGTLGDLVADGLRAAGEGDVAIMNRGGVRADLPAGAISLEHIFEVQPFDNRLVRYAATGAELVAALETVFRATRPRFHFSGMHVTVDTTQAVGSRIVSVTIGGKRLETAGRYRVVINDFMAEGGDGFGRPASALEEVTLSDREALAEYLRRAPQPVRPPTDARVTYQSR